MSTAANFIGESGRPPAEKAVPVEGSFACMTCGESVDVAMHFVLDRILGWKCENGHWSEIEVSW